MTPQRQLILDAICEAQGTARLEDIFQRVHAQAPALNLATVYRNLDFLCQIGLAAVLKNVRGETFYEIALGTPHHHLVCRQCGVQIEIDGKEMTLVAREINEKFGFVVDFDHLTLFGLCKDCQETNLPVFV